MQEITVRYQDCDKRYYRDSDETDQHLSPNNVIGVIFFCLLLYSQPTLKHCTNNEDGVVKQKRHEERITNANRERSEQHEVQIHCEHLYLVSVLERFRKESHLNQDHTQEMEEVVKRHHNKASVLAALRN